VRAYAKIVADKATLRCLIEAGSDIVNDGFDPKGRGTGEIVASAAARVAHLTLRGAREGGLRMVSSGIDEAFEEIVGRDAGTIDVGLTPPWDNVRDILPGLEDTDLLVLAARPGMGKTIAGLEFADHAAAQGRNVGFFSMEMSRRQLITRLIARRAMVDQSLMRQKGGLSQAQWAEINRAIREIRNLSLAIDDTVSLTIDAMKARAARMHAKVQGGLGLIVVDYLQLMECDGVRG
jgi:replicative DNA helicase